MFHAARRRTRFAATLTATAIILTPTPAWAGPDNVTGNPDKQSIDNMDPATLAIMRQQEALNPAANSLIEAARQLPGSGYTGVAFEGAGVSLYWKGDLPSSMANAVTAARKSAAVSVRPAGHSRAELDAAAAKITAAAGRRHNIQSISYTVDGNELTVQRRSAASTNALRQKAGGGFRTAEQIVAEAGVSVPVRMSTAVRDKAQYDCNGVCTRLNDMSPWNSGTHLWGYGVPGPVLGQCTTGFGVYVPALGSNYVLTAAHCATWKPNGGDNFTDGANEHVGRASQVEDYERDIMLIEAYGSSLMFDGGYETSNTKPVRSWGGAIINELVCQSGAMTTTKCDIKTTAYHPYNFICDSDGDCFHVTDLMLAVHIYGETAGTGGDSGGPVFTLDGSGVRAKGIVHGGANAELLFQDMGDIAYSRPGWFAAYPLTR